MTVVEMEEFCKGIRNAGGTDTTEIKVTTERGTLKGLGKSWVRTREGFPVITLAK